MVYSTSHTNSSVNSISSLSTKGNKVNDGALSEDDLAVIGMAVVDLSGQAIARLNPRAFEYALPIFQVIFL